MEQKIITARSASELNGKIKTMQEEGWEPIGGHGVVTTHVQNRYAGKQLMDSVHSTEYSQTMKKS